MKNTLFTIALAVSLLSTGATVYAQQETNRRQHFYVNPAQLEGNWKLVKTEVRKDGKIYKIYERSDLREGIERERLIVMAATTKKKNVDMRVAMKNALFPVKFAPGTKTKVYRETDNEAIMEWWTADQYHSFVRIVTRPGEYHSVTYLYKGTHQPTQNERERWLGFLDRLQLNY
jgi:hypothetical protein